MDPFTLFVLFHSLLSIIALIAGLAVVYHLIDRGEGGGGTRTFLVMAIATSVTGFLFPFNKFLPSHAVGTAALVTLALVLLARYVFALKGFWRPVFVLGLIVNEFFLVFVAIAQAFEKIPALHDLAPTQSEPPFAIAEGIAVVVFIVLGALALRGVSRAHRA